MHNAIKIDGCIPVSCDIRYLHVTSTNECEIWPIQVTHLSKTALAKCIIDFIRKRTHYISKNIARN